MISEKELQAYNAWTNGNKEYLRYEYDLDHDSICFDLGSFHCDWSIAISNKYNNPIIYAFEICPPIYELAKKNIQTYPNIHLFNYGVGRDTSETVIAIGETDGASTSLFISGDKFFATTIKSIKSVFDNLKIDKIDIMKLNVEGSEYDIMESLIEHDLHLRVKNFQIQFHKIEGEYPEKRYEKIRQSLSLSHSTTYDYYFVWENWRLNE